MELQSHLAKAMLILILFFANLKKFPTKGNFILQTARSKENKHKEVLAEYFDMTKKMDYKY